MEYNESTKGLFSVFMRVRRFCRKLNTMDMESVSETTTFGLLFQELQEEKLTQLRMSDVSRQLMISRPAATQVVDRLCERGLVERIRDEEDRRVVSIRPTQKGEELFAQEVEKGFEMIDRVMHRMGIENADKLVGLLDMFMDAMFEEMNHMEEAQGAGEI